MTRASGPAGAGEGLGGYRDRVRRALPAFFEPLEVAAVLPSTMLRAAELAARGAPEGATVVTDVQTAGRGRLDRTWSAPPGTSLLLTVVLRPPLAGTEAWLATAAAGVALVDAVREVLAGPAAVREVLGGPAAGGEVLGGPAAGGGAPARAARGPWAVPAVGLKWPNDLLVGGRKTAGLLAEARVAGGRLEWVLLGMGVNVGQGPDGFPPELAGQATSVALAAGAPVDRAALLRAWAGPFLARYAALAAGDTARVLADYHDRLDTLGREVRADLLGGGPVTGTAVALGPSGSLVVRTPAGRRVEVAAGDVQHLRAGPPRGS
ncbi:MAG TPA: biotin--[acetyl-CoA-carboxylase] ligase [Actinomycetes bacterium]|nr:biotin--[acetyl-CoA-carboxylase] ligase [Actinomycetes bacterium]